MSASVARTGVIILETGCDQCGVWESVPIYLLCLVCPGPGAVERGAMTGNSGPGQAPVMGDTYQERIPEINYFLVSIPV